MFRSSARSSWNRESRACRLVLFLDGFDVTKEIQYMWDWLEDVLQP